MMGVLICILLAVLVAIPWITYTEKRSKAADSDAVAAYRKSVTDAQTATFLAEEPIIHPHPYRGRPSRISVEEWYLIPQWERDLLREESDDVT